MLNVTLRFRFFRTAALRGLRILWVWESGVEVIAYTREGSLIFQLLRYFRLPLECSPFSFLLRSMFSF